MSRVIHGVKGCSTTMLKGSSNYHDDQSLGIIMMTRIMISSQSTVRYDPVHEADDSMFRGFWNYSLAALLGCKP